MKDTSAYILPLRQIGNTEFSKAGGKAFNLAALARLPGIRVPDGFCITTDAFETVIGEMPGMNQLLDRLSGFATSDRDEIVKVSAEIRSIIRAAHIPAAIADAISGLLSTNGGKSAYAIRSSATAEDLPTASFAGQHDTYLNVSGKEAVLEHVRRCWASLFTERAVIYRIQKDFGHRDVNLAVIVQEMIFPEAAGIMFTADPVTSSRKVLSVDAGFGLGEAMVSGLVNADTYRVRDGKVVHKKIAIKKMAVYAANDGGIKEQELAPEQQRAQVLTEEQILELERTGRMIEGFFESPQDIEWCLAGGVFYILQSRPVTALYPVPEADDGENHVYVSVGHQQMMTDPIKPLGLSFFLLTTPARMRTAGGRLFVDVTENLASPSGRKMVIDALGQSDPLIKDALLNISGREGFIKMKPDDQKETGADNLKEPISPPVFSESPEAELAADAPQVVADLIRRNRESIEALEQNIRGKSGTDLFDFILEDLGELKKLLFDPQSGRVIMAAMNASFWINEKMQEWLGEKNAADTLSQSVPGNITSEMGLALLDLADVVRPYPEVIAYLQHAKGEDFMKDLVLLDGGREANEAIDAYLHKYGMRCAGEIDLTKARWSERPSTLIPLILGNVKNFKPAAGRRKFEAALQEALEKEQELLDRLMQLPDGAQKAAEAKQKIGLIRNFTGYREFPKYGMVSRYFIYKQALLKEATQLLREGVIREMEDIYYLSFEELRNVVRTRQQDDKFVQTRKEAYKIYEKLVPPRVITSEGEIISGEYKRENLPENAIAGLAVSSGIVEGRARVIHNIEDADLETGDILVTTFTDPSWTPLFVAVKGLVTEVGGLMTHGAVIAREYGLPAVVGVENATRLISDGQRIRVNGTDGYVELL